MAQSVLIIGDTHFPYTDTAGIKQVITAAKATKPTYIVQMGDLFDQYAFSKYPTNPNHETPKAELLRGRKAAERMWQELRRASPKSACHQLLGNHDMRLPKRWMEKTPEAYEIAMAGLRPYFEFPGVETQDSDRSELELRINGELVVFHHGFLTKLGDHAKYFESSCVVGHSHTPGIVYQRTRKSTRFELNAGYLGDPKAHVFKYSATSRKTWTRSYGIIDSYGPRVVALES